MWVIRSGDDHGGLSRVLDAVVARVANIEHGCERFLADLSPGSGEPMVVSEGALRFRVRTNTGFIYCSVRGRSLDELRNDLMARLSDFPVDHLAVS